VKYIQKEVLGGDIGGTNIKAESVMEERVLQWNLKLVKRDDSEKTTLKKLFNTMDQIITASVEAIRIKVQAILDPESGVVYDVQNIPAWTKIRLKKLVHPSILGAVENCLKKIIIYK
jgi:glucokinase